MWVCFDVLFFISEFKFLFLLIFILFWLACIYLCCCCFPLGVYFNVCLFAYFFVVVFQVFDIVCLLFVSLLFAVVYTFCISISFILIEIFPLKNIARLYVARRYFVVDKIKRLLDKLFELLQFYVEIVILIRNQVC